MTFAEKMRRTRMTPQYCYMQYDKIRQKKPHAFIAFFEGYDAPYYIPVIASVSGLEAEQVICGNKRNVIAVHESLLAKDVLRNAKTGFFIDRDFDDNSSIPHRLDFFLTKGYSVENYYCSQTSFENILKSYMHYNCAHPDYDVIVTNYVELQRLYHAACLEFNGWYCSLKKNMTSVAWSLNETMPSGYVKLDLSQFKVEKDYTMTKIHHTFKADPQPIAADVQKWSVWIMQDPVYRMRGKYEFAFLLAYLSSLSKMVNNPASPFEEHSMNFSMGQRDALSALAQYADRDDDLKDYVLRRAA